MRFASESRPFVLPFALGALLCFALRRPYLGLTALLVGLLVLLFFRDPPRHFDGEGDVILAPADGLITRVDQVEDPEVGPGPFHRVVTFLSVFDVHVQKTPAAGEVIASSLRTGQKKAAFRSDAGVVNEQQLTVIRRTSGDLIAVRQIAGLLARRIVCYLRPGQTITRGQAMGLIKFGSRVDLLVPAHYEMLVAKGERLRNGATPVAVARPLAG
jgi:phosphatidylserine decarboxylase